MNCPFDAMCFKFDDDKTHRCSKPHAVLHCGIYKGIDKFIEEKINERFLSK